MIKFTVEVTVATVAVKSVNGYEGFQTLYTTGKVKKRAFQKLINKHSATLKYICLEVKTSKFECDAEINETITSAIEKTLANNDIDCSCFIENDINEEGDSKEENDN